jgi:crotonobetainyl-CoA:carnitine CoA-transferase CaiB-like acyl-CoA transferase
LIGRSEWLGDARYATADLRRANAADLQAALGATLRLRPAAEWEALMSAAGIPCGMVRNVAEAASLPHLGQRDLKIPLNIPGLPQGNPVEILNAGFLFQADGPHVSEPPPRKGQHSEEILRSLGFSDDELKTIVTT